MRWHVTYFHQLNPAVADYPVLPQYLEHYRHQLRRGEQLLRASHPKCQLKVQSFLDYFAATASSPLVHRGLKILPHISDLPFSGHSLSWFSGLLLATFAFIDFCWRPSEGFRFPFEFVFVFCLGASNSNEIRAWSGWDAAVSLKPSISWLFCPKFELSSIIWRCCLRKSSPGW